MRNIPWSELRPPGCSCRSWYERRFCCEGCEPHPVVYPEDIFFRWSQGLALSLLGVAAVILIVGGFVGGVF